MESKLASILSTGISAENTMGPTGHSNPVTIDRRTIRKCHIDQDCSSNVLGDSTRESDCRSRSWMKSLRDVKRKM